MILTRYSFFCFAFCALFFVSSNAQPVPTTDFPFKITVEQYIEKYYSIAVEEMYRNRIPASITLAQGLLESGNGNSRLALVANNHFGIKCKSDWTGESINEDDDAPQECFRKYPTALDSYKDHSDFLKKGQRYSFLFDLEMTDYKSWAYGLKKAGYATNPRYAEILISTIERNNLQRFDLMKPTESEIKEVVEEHKEFVSEHKSLVINNIPAIVVKPNDSYASIAVDNNMRVWQIYKYNDLSKTDSIEPGDTIYLKPKNYKGPIEFVQMGKEDNMRLISQRYAIKLSRLLKLNLLKAGQEIAAGETVYLRSKRSSVPPLRVKLEPVVPKDTVNQAVYEDPKKNIETLAPVLPKDEYNLEDKGVKDDMAFIHTVQPKETLFSIAKKYNVQVEDIKALNKLQNEDIKVGDKLIINPNQPPIKPNEESVIPGYHTVLLGETLYSISKLYNTTVSEIKALNELKSDTINVGDELIVVALNGEKPIEETVVPVEEAVYHTVKEKETLYFISRKYNVEQSEIRRLNYMIDNTIQVGQKLRIR